MAAIRFLRSPLVLLFGCVSACLLSAAAAPSGFEIPGVPGSADAPASAMAHRAKRRA
jgi:hypothetical protein